MMRGFSRAELNGVLNGSAIFHGIFLGETREKFLKALLGKLFHGFVERGHMVLDD